MLPLTLRGAWPALALAGLGACEAGEAHAPVSLPVEPAPETELIRLLGPLPGAHVARGSLHVSTALHASIQPSSASASASSGPAGLPRARVEAALPTHAGQPFTLREPRTQLSVQVQLEGSQLVTGRTLGALRVYEGAQGPGRSLVLRPTLGGVEDYLSLPTAPAEPRVEYRLTLSPGVRGLRLVAGTLELLDAGGAPRLRVAPPFLIEADGARRPAQLEVLDCNVDTNPAPPWDRAPLAPGAESCGLRVKWDGEGLKYPALVDPFWSGADQMNEARDSFASFQLPGGRVLVAGGRSGAPAAPLASAEVYDAQSDSWSVTGSLFTARSDFTLSARGGKGGQAVLAVGGEGGSGALASTELYDPESGLWSVGPELPVPYAGHSAVLEQGDLLIAGGASRQTALLAATASSWTPAGELLALEPGSSLTVLRDGDVLLVGPNAPSAQRWSRSSGGWRETAEPALARSGHSATVLQDGSVLVVGGSGLRSAELYDPEGELFQRVGALNEPRTRHTATALPDGRVAVIGGSELAGAIGTEIYNPRWGTWVPGPGTAQGRALHRAEPLADGRVLALGGRGPEGAALASAELLDARVLPTVIHEYKLPARLDPEVTSAAATELWAAVVRPETLAAGHRYPLLLFLHGNHGTCGTGENPRQDGDCTYTDSGLCPPGSVVVPSHRGYDYVATELAARGFIVVSVNANRGITCGGGEPGDFSFNLARGRLILQHLRQLSDWARGLTPTPESLGVSLEGQLDLDEVGLMGHSRGGEGMRALYEQYREADSPWPRRIGVPVTFRALFEIGPVDGQAQRTLNADGLAWNVLLPMCDGDVSSLDGIKPFDRMLALRSELRETPKSTYVAWGTNHNYFNTEWQQSDSPGCQDHRASFDDGPGISGSAEQRQTGLRSMLAFFLAHVGKDRNPALSALFDPTVPITFDTRVDRAYTPSVRANRGFTLEDFSGPSDRNQRGTPTQRQGVTVVHRGVPEHDEGLRAALVSWTEGAERPAGVAAPPERFLQIPFSAMPGGIDLSGYTHFEFRVGRAEADDLELATPLSLQLLGADGSASEPVSVESQGVLLDGPVGGPFGTHVVLQTVRIPLRAFEGVEPEALGGVRFSFPAAPGASLYLAQLRATLGTASLSPLQATTGTRTQRPGGSATAAGEGAPAQPVSQVLPGQRVRPLQQVVREGNDVVGLRALRNGAVEIELSTRQAFRAQDDQLVLTLGNVRSAQARHPGGSLSRVIFTLDGNSFGTARDGAPLVVGYASNVARRWDFGVLEKSALRR